MPFEDVPPDLPAFRIGSALVDLVLFASARSGSQVAIEHVFANGQSTGSGDVTGEEHVEIQSAVVEPFDVVSGEFGECDRIHQEPIKDSLDGRDAGIVDFNGAVNHVEARTQTADPGRFELREQVVGFGQDRGAGSRAKLAPGHCNPKTGASLGVRGSPELDEVDYLPVQLNVKQMDELTAS